MSEEKQDSLSMDEEAQLRLLESALMVRRGGKVIVEIGGEKWAVRQTSTRQNQLMSDIDIDIMFWQRQLKAAESAREAKRLNGKIRKAYARKAAHKVLGKRLRWVPFAWAYMWRRLYHSSEAVSATINATESIGENKVFYLANLGSSKQALALCMAQVGESVKQLMQRMESAENMVRKDGSGTRAASTSGTSLKRPPTKKR